MDFYDRRKVRREELGVIKIASEFLARLLESDDRVLFRSRHGIRDMKIHSIFFDMCMNSLYAVISSPDIPAYVAYQKIMGVLEHYDSGKHLYPLVDLIYQILELEKEDFSEDHSGSGFGYKQEEEDGSE